MAADGVIKIDIEVDGKQISVASKALDKLEESGHRSGKGIKAAESNVISLSDRSAKASSSVKSAGDAIEGLGESGSKAGKGLKGTEGAVDSLSDSSSRANSSIQGASDAIDGLGDSGSSTSRDLRGVDSTIDGLADSSAGATSSIQGVSNSLDGLSDSGADSSRSLRGADSAIDELSDSSAGASRSLQGTSSSLNSVSDSANEAANNTRRARNETESIGQETGRATITIKNLATSLGLVAIASAAFNTLKSPLDSAISRFDTLNSFPKVLQALGVSAEDSEKAMQKLGDGIDGLPTTLNDIAGSAQRMYTSFSDMDKATDTAIALNNALLGSGSSAETAKRGADQYIKALQTGKLQMDTWNTLSETMDVGLIKIAEAFGYAGKSAKDDLYKALQDGTVTLDQFNDKLIEVGTGTGIMAKLARENSLGIATSLGNLKNAAARGIANIIESFNNLSKAVTGKDIAQNIDSLKAIVNSSFKVIQGAIEATTPFFKAFSSAVKAVMPVVKALSPALIGLASAYAIHTVINKTTTAIKANETAIAIATAVKKLYTVATNRQAAAEVLHATKTKLAGIALLAYNKIVAIATTVQTMLTSGMSLAAIASVGLSGAISVLGTAIKVLLGPIGWVTLAIGALVGAVVGIIKWFNKASEEGKKMTEETEKMGDSVNELSDSVSQSSKAYKDNQTEIKATAQANSDLAKKVEDLANKENKSAAEKKLLNDYIERLNGSVEGLNLAYNEEADALSMSSEEMRARIDLTKEQTSYNDAMERQVEISKEQNEVGMKLDEVNALQDEWNKKKEEGTVKSKEAKEALAELDEQEQTLKETNNKLKEQYKETEKQIEVSIEAISEAVKNGAASQMVSFDMLSESNQQMVEDMKSSWLSYQEAATDMFNVLSDKSELSVAEMQKNLDENQRIIGEWAEGIATLAERGVDEGLLETLRAAGPESAGHVNALVNASDEELSKLSETFSDGGKVATDALSKSLGIEESGVLEVVGHLVTGTKEALSKSVKEANFLEIGVDIAKGQAQGIEKGTSEAEKAAENMAKSTEDAARKQSETRSPSRVFMRIGEDLAGGLALGINDGTTKVTQAIQKLFKAVETDSSKSFKTITKNNNDSVKEIEKNMSKLAEIAQKAMQNMLNRLTTGAMAQMQLMRLLARDLVSPFMSTPSQFYSIGTHAMSGLNAGLNAGRGRVMATARSIANQVRSTMKKALDIHSPSRVMRDDVGKWIPAGIALGIEQNAKSVYKALDNLSDGMILTSTPEMALGTSKMAYSSGGNQVVDALRNFKLPAFENSNQDGSNVKQPAIVNVYVGAKQVAREVVDDISNLQNRSANRKLKRPGRGGGLV